MDDPAAVIAHALRKKFSHRIFQDSPGRREGVNINLLMKLFVDKENVETSFTDSPGPSMRLVFLYIMRLVFILSFFVV